MFVGIEEVRGYADELFSWAFLSCTLKSHYTGASDFDREYNDSNMGLAGRTLLPNGDIR